jgi:hypothetical protein
LSGASGFGFGKRDLAGKDRIGIVQPAIRCGLFAEALGMRRLRRQAKNV